MIRNKHLTALVTCALLVAIEIVLSRFLSISTPIVKIGFDFLPMALAGILFGPWYACAVGAMADFVGALLFPIGPYFPGFTLVAGLCGLTYGLLLYNKTGVRWNRSALMIRAAIAVLIVTLPLQLGLDTLWISLLYDKGYLALVPARIVKALVMIPIQYITINTLYHFATIPGLRLAR